MRYLMLSFSLLLWFPLQAAELLLLSTSPAELYQRIPSSYYPVAMVQQVLQHYPAPYQIETVSLNRGLAGIRSRTGACVPVVQKTATRSQEFLYSQPFVIAPELRLLLKAESPWVKRLQKLQGAADRISLAKVLAQPDPPVLVTEDGRAYGAAIDPILAAHRQSKAVYVRTAKVSRYGETLPMLYRGFVDMALEFPVALSAAERADLHSFRLQEADVFTLAYFACKRDAETAGILQQLDEAILKFRHQPDFQQWLLQPFPPAERAQIWQAWQQRVVTPPPEPQRH